MSPEADDRGYTRQRPALPQSPAAAGADYAAVLIAFHQGLATAGLPDELAWNLTETLAATLLATRQRDLLDTSRPGTTDPGEALRVWFPQ